MIPIPLLKLGVAGLLVAAFGAWCWTGGAAHKQKEFDLYKGEQAKAALLESEKARATEQALQRKVDDANTALQAERAKHARVAAGLRAESDRLRNDIASFASGATEEPLSTCRDRSEALGALLGESLQVAAEGAADAEHCESNVRALLTAWPN